MLCWADKVRIDILNVIDELILVLGHFEKVRGFLDLFEWFSRRRIQIVAECSIVFRNEGLFTDIVPSFVRIEIDIAVGVASFPQFLGRLFVSITGGTNVIVVADQGALIQVLKARDELKTNKINLRVRTLFG